MAVRSVWRGTLKIGLVMLPCKMVASTEPEDKVRFHTIHHKCGGRLKSKSWCPTCNAENGQKALRGFEIRKGEFVVVTDEELAAVEDDASSMLEVTTVTREAVDPRRIDATMYLVPSDAGMAQAFETLREAVGDRLAVGTVVLRKKACHVALQPDEKGVFLVYKLRSDEQVRDFSDIAADLGLSAAPPDPNRAELKMATQLIDGMEGSFSYADVSDEYTARLRAFIDAKDKGKVPVAAARRVANVTSLADALAASLKQVQAAPAAKKMVKAAVAAVKVGKQRKTA